MTPAPPPNPPRSWQKHGAADEGGADLLPGLRLIRVPLHNRLTHPRSWQRHGTADEGGADLLPGLRLIRDATSMPRLIMLMRGWITTMARGSPDQVCMGGGLVEGR